jgi:tetratricopeptide (TPR) repeat protein
MSDNTTMGKRDFFISYNKADKDLAKQIGKILADNGYSVHIQAWGIRPGNDFIKKMNEFLEDSKGFIAVVSRNYFDSPYCDIEWWTAFNKYVHTRGEYRFFAFRAEDVAMPELTQTTVYKDLFELEDIKDAVLKTVDEKPIPRKKSADDTATQQIRKLPERNLDFSGRTEDLLKLDIAFREDRTGLVKQIICGLGGVGKTSLALEYAYRSIHKYADAIWWINAETAHGARDDLLRFAERLGLLTEGWEAAQSLTDERLRERLQGWFEKHPSFLIIFDNVESADDIRGLLPHDIGHVLITARDYDIRLKNAKSLELGVFTDDEAKEFLIEHAPKATKDEKALDKLIVRLGRLPLGLKQAAAYMTHRANNCDCEKYLELLDKHGLRVFEGGIVKPEDYHAIVSTTWQVSIEKVSKSAKQLLYLCAYMAADNIPLEFFIRQRKVLPEPLQSQLSDDFTINQIVQDATRYALAERKGDNLNIHRLVQDVIREQAESDSEDWLQPVFDAMANALPRRKDYGTREARGWFEQIAQHAAVVVGHAGAYEDEDNKEQSALLCHLIGAGHNASARYSQALEWYYRDLAICEKVLGAEHPSTATSYNNIGFVYESQGDYDKALEWYQKASKILEKVLGVEHPDTATSYNNIAGVYDSQGDYDKALELYHKALEIREKVLGTEHPDTATSYNNIGFVYRKQGDYGKALEWYQRSSELYEKVLGTEHPSTAIPYNNIGLVYSKQGDYDKALEWYQKATEIFEKVLGAEHPSTATSYNNIGLVYANQGDYDKALEWYQKALKVREKVLGIEHPDTATSYGNIGLVYGTLGDYDKALKWNQKALEIQEKVLGAEHPDTATSYGNIAGVYESLGNYDKALELYQKALAIRENVLGAEHPSTATSYNNIGLAYHNQGDYDKALAWYHKALAICEKVLGTEHPNTIITRKNMDYALSAKNNPHP